MMGSTNAGGGVKTTLTVSVVDNAQTGKQEGRSITITNDIVTQTAVTDANGQAVFTLKSIGKFRISSDAPAGYYTKGANVETALGGSYIVQLQLYKGIHFGMSFDAAVFQTDPTACLTYTDDCVGFTPVSGPGNNVLAKCSTIGSWEMNADGTSSNPLLRQCFYATFDSNGILHEKLNPQDLTQVIATWDNSLKEWVSASGASHITTEDTMFCIPTLYLASDDSSIDLFETPDQGGVAYAHTIGGHTYEYLAIGVYEGSLSNELHSWSGVAGKADYSRGNFRNMATSKTIQNGYAMVWNFYQWTLWKVMVFFAMKSFNGQSQVGVGGPQFNSGTQGKCNQMGPFAGSTSRLGVKAFVDYAWCHLAMYIDDFVVDVNTSTNKCDVWAGQNIVPDNSMSSPKTKIYTFDNNTGWPLSISTEAESWGMRGETLGGSSTTGLCDNFNIVYCNGASVATVGYYADTSAGSDPYAGPSAMRLDTINTADQTKGARLAFVFDL